MATNKQKPTSFQKQSMEVEDCFEATNYKSSRILYFQGISLRWIMYKLPHAFNTENS